MIINVKYLPVTIVVLIDCFKPTHIIMGMRHNMDIYISWLSLGAGGVSTLTFYLGKVISISSKACKKNYGSAKLL